MDFLIELFLSVFIAVFYAILIDFAHVVLDIISFTLIETCLNNAHLGKHLAQQCVELGKQT